MDFILLAQIDPPPKVDTLKRYVNNQSVTNWEQPTQWRCLHQIITIESGWSPKAQNPTSSARGLFQQLNTPPSRGIAAQVRLGLKYILHRYGTPCKALHHHNKKGWY